MVLCWIALPIFAFLGIFSVKYRKLTKDSLNCLFKTVTLRKCSTGLDDKIKSDITGTFLKVSPRLARGFYKNYKIISFLVLVLFLVSTYFGAVGVYNYAKYGNCNGPESVNFCVFDPTGSGNGLTEIDMITHSSTVLYPKISSDDPIIGNKEAKLTIIEFGCYTCAYTKKAEPVVKEVLDYYKGKVNIQFKTIAIPAHILSFEAALAANCAMEQSKYYEYHSLLFNMQEQLNENTFFDIANRVGLNMNQFSGCYSSKKYNDEINEDTLEGVSAGIVGTPTFFVNDKKIVGTKPLKTFKEVIDEELKK